MIPRMTAICKKLADGLTFKKILLILLGAMICTFGIHNIHQRTNITEGGVIGLMLLVEHWLKISPAYISPMLDAACYLLAFKFLGGNFIKISIISTLFVSVFYHTADSGRKVFLLVFLFSDFLLQSDLHLLILLYGLPALLKFPVADR